MKSLFILMLVTTMFISCEHQRYQDWRAIKLDKTETKILGLKNGYVIGDTVKYEGERYLLTDSVTY